MQKEKAGKKIRTKSGSINDSGLVDLATIKYDLPDEETYIGLGSKSGEEKERARSRWLTMQMVNYQNRELYLKITLRELIFYVIFMILLSIAIFGSVSSRMYYLTNTFVDLTISKTFRTWNDEIITFKEITRPNDFWEFMDYMVNNFHLLTLYDEVTLNADQKRMLLENRLIGVPRLRSLRVRNNSCVIHKFLLDLFLNCFGDYYYGVEDKSAIDLTLPGTAWRYSSPHVTGSYAFSGKAATYYGGGHYVDLGVDIDRTLDILTQLKDHNWIRRGTRMICLDFTVYNGNLNLFLNGKYIFEMPPTGGILPSFRFTPMKLIRFVDKWDYLATACEWLCVCFIFFYTFEEIRELFYFQREYFRMFWNYIDLTVIIFGYVAICLQIAILYENHSTLKRNMRRKSTYANFELITNLYVTYVCVLALMLFFVHIKLFKFLSFNKRMGQLNNTLQKCAVDIGAFAIMFFIVFIAYAQLGYLFFGTHIEGFGNLGSSMFTLLRTILGDFNYMELEEANPILAPIFFVTYIFLVFFVLLNMFLAIINDTYSDIKTEMVVRSDEMQMLDYIMRGLYRFLDKCGCGQFVPKPKIKQQEFNLSVQQLQSALIKCGFLNEEIADFLSRYNVDPNVGIDEFDSNKLMAELQENFENDRYAEFLKKGGKKGKHAEEFKPKSGGLISIEDFILHQEKLHILENTIFTLSQRVELLIRKLETLDNVRKAYVGPNASGSTSK